MVVTTSNVSQELLVGNIPFDTFEPILYCISSTVLNVYIVLIEDPVVDHNFVNRLSS